MQGMLRYLKSPNDCISTTHILQNCYTFNTMGKTKKKGRTGFYIFNLVSALQVHTDYNLSNKVQGMGWDVL